MILIVDDHLDTGAVLARLLKKCGYTAVAVGSGRAALEMLASSRPSLIVLDMSMPDMDGLTVLRAIRSGAEAKDVPVVVYSADFTDETMRKAKALGAKEYLVKGTVGWPDLCETIKRYAA